MRISDWSSDVCSSDLFCSHQIRCHDLCADHGKNDNAIVIGLDRGRTEDRLAQMIVPFALETPPYPCPHGKMLPMHIFTSHDASKCESFIIDRKRVVSGKSVSVRVDLGGCRFIK